MSITLYDTSHNDTLIEIRRENDTEIRYWLFYASSIIDVGLSLLKSDNLIKAELYITRMIAQTPERDTLLFPCRWDCMHIYSTILNLINNGVHQIKKENFKNNSDITR